MDMSQYQSLINGLLFLLLGIVGWFVRGTVSRIDECQRHTEERVTELKQDLESWKLLSTAAHERLAGADSKLEVVSHVLERAISEINGKVDKILDRMVEKPK